MVGWEDYFLTSRLFPVIKNILAHPVTLQSMILSSRCKPPLTRPSPTASLQRNSGNDWVCDWGDLFPDPKTPPLFLNWSVWGRLKRIIQNPECRFCFHWKGSSSRRGMERSEGKLVIVNLTTAGGQRLRGQCLLGFWNKLEGNKLGRLLLMLLSERSPVAQTWAY